jgi:TetR/AcrR family transcriptional regulator
MTARTSSPAREPAPTREALLAAATEAFAAHGFDGARVDRIAAAAGVNKAMISYHFGGKAGLHRAILEASLGALAARLAHLRRERLPADARLRAFVEAFVETVESQPFLPQMLLREVIGGGRRLDPVVGPYFLQLAETVRGIVTQGAREGTLCRVDPLLTHLTVVGSLVFFFATQPFRARLIREGRVALALPAPRAFVDHLETLLIRGLAPHPARPRRSR